MVMPPILEPIPTLEEIRDREVNSLRAQIAGWAGAETDPLYKAIENRAAREILLRSYFNSRARSLLPAFAEGSDLDAIIARVGMERFSGETDDAVRTRLRGWIGQTVALGSDVAYQAHARNASTLVRDVGIEVNAATRVVSVYLLTTENDNGNPETATNTGVQAYMRDSRRVLLGWTVNVVAPTITAYTVTGAITYRRGGDEDALLAAARTSVYAYLESRHSFGRSVYRSGLVAALMSPADAVSASVTAPATDLTVASTDKHTVYYCPADTTNVVITATEEA